ncbi:MAG: TRAP transporter substrate-binding protein DctP [Dehalococcoidales bacterium]|nr:TRAP transporter substrate-binding protein DctP [Dehalococcoidales bacterium]
MKKGIKFLFFLMIVVSILSLSITGCSKPAAPTTPGVTTSAATTPAATTPAATTPATTKPAPTPAAQVIKIKMQTAWPAADTGYIRAEQLAKWITDACGGRLEITPYTGGAIVPATKEIDPLDKGVIDIVMANHMYHISIFPAAGLFGPKVGGLTGVQLMLWLTNGGGNELATRMYATLPNVVYISTPVIVPPEVWCHTDRDLQSVADIKGMKMRGAGEPAEILNKMGLSMVTLPVGEIYQAFATKVIDAYEITTPMGNWANKCQEIGKYMYLSPSRAPTDTAAFFVNKGVWNKIPADLQKVVKYTTEADMLPFFGFRFTKDFEAMEQFKAYGTIIRNMPKDIDDALYAEAKKFYAEKAAKDAFYAEVIKSQDKFKEMCEAQGVR